MTRKHNPFADIASLRKMAATESPSTKRRTKSRRTWQSKFVRVPNKWVKMLAACRSANAYRLALYLLDEHRRLKGGSIPISNLAALNGAAIGRMAKWRALRELEALGLIRLEQRHGKSPLVWLNEV
jgi:hypothetical protein